MASIPDWLGLSVNYSHSNPLLYTLKTLLSCFTGFPKWQIIYWVLFSNLQAFSNLWGIAQVFYLRKKIVWFIKWFSVYIWLLKMSIFSTVLCEQLQYWFLQLSVYKKIVILKVIEKVKRRISCLGKCSH